MRRKKEERPGPPFAKKPWWEEIRGTFKDDPAYNEAMRLGREWREAQRPEYDEETDTRCTEQPLRSSYRFSLRGREEPP